MNYKSDKVTPEYLNKQVNSWAFWLGILACLHLGAAVLSFIGEANGEVSRFALVQFGSAILIGITAFLLWKRSIYVFLTSGFYMVLSFLSPLILGQSYQLLDLLMLAAPFLFYRTMIFFGKHGVFSKGQTLPESQETQ